MKAASLILLFIAVLSSSLFGAELKDSDKYFDHSGQRKKEYKFTYKDHDHTFKENVQDLALVYGVSAVFYPITQPEILDSDAGSWKKYKENFGHLVFDQDEAFWNFFVHPLTGSQTFLYFRAKGYAKMEAFKMAFITSALFEFTIETFSEPASVQDLVNTPILGSILGSGIEGLSLYLLNSGSTLGRIFGHLINPCTLLWFYDGKVRITPHLNPKGANGVTLVVDF